MHLEFTGKIRIVRRLDFTESARVRAPYEEHGAMLQGLRRGAIEEVVTRLALHIDASHAKARKITLLRLQNARKSLQPQRAAVLSPVPCRP